MRTRFQLILILCSIMVAVYAQNGTSSLLNIGSPAPPLQVGEWMKGTPIQEFEKGKIYVVDFWATWCRPCIEGMPHLSALARKYRNRVEVLGIDIKKKNNFP